MANSSPSEQASLYQECTTALVEGTKKLYGDDEYADLTIQCGDRTFRVHKAILCPRSDFFGAACKKHAFKEGQENKVVLVSDEEAEGGDDPDIVGLMIEYIYCLDYTVITKWQPSKPFAHGKDLTATTHAQVFAIAEKYGIPPLKKKAHYKFKEYLAAYVLSIHDLAETIRAVYNTTPDHVSELRDEIFEHIGRLNSEVLEDVEVRAAIESTPSLAYDLFLRHRSHGGNSDGDLEGLAG